MGELSAEQKLKEMLLEINGGLKKEIQEEHDEKIAQLEDRLGNTISEEIAKLGKPTVDAPEEKTMILNGKDDKPFAKKIYEGYRLDEQGLDLAIRMNEFIEGRPDIAPHLKRTSLIGDNEYREKYSKFILDVLLSYQGSPDAQKRLWESRQAYKANTMNETTDAQGGYLVPDEFSAEILAFARLSSVALQQCRIWPMSSDVRKIPAESTNVSVAWGTESTAATQTQAAPTQVTLTAKKLDAFTVVSNELIQDSAIDIVSWLTSQFAEAIGQELDNQVFNGTGTPCSGILQNTSVYSVVMTSGLVNFSSVTADNLSDMMSKLSPNKRIGARFFMEKAVLHYLRILKGNDSYHWGQMSANQPNTIWGYPYSEVEQMPSAGDTAVSTAFVALGNLRNFCLGRRIQSMTLDVDPYGLFTQYDTRFRIVNRFGMVVGLPAGFVKLVTPAS